MNKNYKSLRKSMEKETNKSAEKNSYANKEVNLYIYYLKEKWNNRFHLEKVPLYNAFQDKNCKLYY